MWQFQHIYVSVSLKGSFLKVETSVFEYVVVALDSLPGYIGLGWYLGNSGIGKKRIFLLKEIKTVSMWEHSKTEKG